MDKGLNADGQMSHDLGSMGLNRVERLERSNTYVVMADGQRVAIFYSKRGRSITNRHGRELGRGLPEHGCVRR